MSWEGVIYVLDLEACLFYSDAGDNLKIDLFERSKEARIVVTKETLKQVKSFDSDLAKEIESSEIEIVELDNNVHEAASALTDILILSGYKLNSVANEKIPVIALVHCAQNGQSPPCHLVTGDHGSHTSSMKPMCTALGIPIRDITDGL